MREILLTPGPITTSDETKAAMLRDWGSREDAFIKLTARIRKELLTLVKATDSHTCLPVQGSGTFAVEATLQTLLSPTNSKLLILINGAYGIRMAQMCKIMGRAFEIYETAEDTPPETDYVAAMLRQDPLITHVAAVHCETTSGILNPIEAISEVVFDSGRSLIVDAMSSFGSINIDLSQLKADALIASANKCLESVPGVSFALINKKAIEAAEGNASSHSLDLFDQFKFMEQSGQWRFTPPTHVLAALDQALRELHNEGGVTARGKRYAKNCKFLVGGLERLGFQMYLPKELRAPIIITVRMPADDRFEFKELYDALNDQGVVLYPGAISKEKSFRIGCIGHIFLEDMDRAVTAIEKFLKTIGVSREGLKPAV